MEIEVRRTPLAAGHLADPDAIEAAIDDNTMMIVGSAPAFPFGVIDPPGVLLPIGRSQVSWYDDSLCGAAHP